MKFLLTKKFAKTNKLHIAFGPELLNIDGFEPLVALDDAGLGELLTLP
jgi:hypothetical protein